MPHGAERVRRRLLALLIVMFRSTAHYSARSAAHLRKPRGVGRGLRVGAIADARTRWRRSRWDTYADLFVADLYAVAALVHAAYSSEVVGKVLAPGGHTVAQQTHKHSPSPALAGGCYGGGGGI